MKTSFNTIASGKQTHNCRFTTQSMCLKKKKDGCIQAKSRRECEKYEMNLCLGGKMRSFF